MCYLDAIMIKQLMGLYEQYENSYVMQGAVASLIIQVFSMLLTVFSGIIMARWLGETSFGVYSYFSNWIQILYVIALVGWYDLLMKNLPPYIDTEQKDKAFVMVKKSFFFTLITTALTILVWIFCIKTGLLQAISITNYSLLVLTMAVGCAVFMTLQQVILRSHKEVILAQIPEKILRPIFIIIIGYIGYSTTNTLNPSSLTAIFVAALSYYFASTIGFAFLAYKTAYFPALFYKKTTSANITSLAILRGHHSRTK